MMTNRPLQRLSLKHILIALAWVIFVLGIVISVSGFFVGENNNAYRRGAWADYLQNPPGFEYVP